jgi:hypothetical protein
LRKGGGDCGGCAIIATANVAQAMVRVARLRGKEEGGCKGLRLEKRRW